MLCGAAVLGAHLWRMQARRILRLLFGREQGLGFQWLPCCLSLRVNSRGYRHVCDVVLKANYGNGAYAESIVKTMGGLSVQAGRALRELFGDDILACREALMPFDQASRIHRHPEHWDPFALQKRGRQVV